MPSQVNNELYQNSGFIKKTSNKRKSQILVDQSVLVIKTPNTYFKQEICL